MNNELEPNQVPEPERGDSRPDAMEPAISPGRELATRREELGLTVEQVAGQLNLAPRQVEAIEADDFDALPGMAIARGFVRSYAKLVRLDAEPLLAAMAPAVAPMPEARPIKQTYVNKPLSGNRLSFGDSSQRKSKMVWLIVVLVIVVAGLFAIQQNGPISLPGVSEGSDETTLPAETDQPAQEAVQDGQAVEVLPAPEVVPDAAPEAPSDEPAPQSSAPAQALQVKSEASAGEQGAAAVDTNSLLIKAREESWVELKRADGAVLAARLIEAGTEASFPLKGEMALTIGNAKGVDVVVRGEPLDLQSRARGNVVRINLN